MPVPLIKQESYDMRCLHKLCLKDNNDAQLWSEKCKLFHKEITCGKYEYIIYAFVRASGLSNISRDSAFLSGRV